ncbi:cytidylate kinase-like family protein [uncultured Prevotella sp.]|uniref:cytidylate kinase-like family protein n=1 Tax=uncultured Prevotella sp. TaxID=159272 RepID=UPI00261F1AAC|nr:cytidylate kinase-like family protein [uncultured Prevotella sp.]
MESNRKIIINVGRQIGSGGRIIARMLADDFKCGFYDRELLTLAAKESGFCEKFFEQNDEQKGFFHSLFHLHSPFVGDGGFYDNEFSQEGLFKFQSDTIRRLAEAGSCVFVGRCADYVLRDFKNVVNVFITANMDDRISEIRKRKECTEAEAMKLIESGEKGRSTYYNYYTGKKWGDSSSYDLCVNTSLLGLEATEAYIKEFIQKVLNIDL